jgi:hypothetical protein
MRCKEVLPSMRKVHPSTHEVQGGLALCEMEHSILERPNPYLSRKVIIQ